MKCPVCDIEFGDYTEELRQHCEIVHRISLEELSRPIRTRDSTNTIPMGNNKNC